MRGEFQKKQKSKLINLSQTTQLTSSTMHNQQSSKDSLRRYIRRPSLPSSLGQQLMNLRNSHQQMETDIYFNPSKKSKFMKQIVDNYFEDTLQKIYGNERQNFNRNLQRNAKANTINKRSKLFFSSSIQSHPPPPPKLPKSQKQPIEQQPQHLQSINSSTNSSANTSSFLPPIYQSNQDADTIFPKVLMGETTQQFVVKDRGESQTDKTLSFQNEAFRIYTVSHGGVPRYRVKEFKQSGVEILRREERVLKFGVERIWKESHINSVSFISQMVHPLKNVICKLIPHHQGIVKFKVRSSAYRKYLLQNNCLQLRNFIRQICSIVKKIEGRVLNNKLNPSNIFILKGNKVCIGQWGYSSFRDQYYIQENKFQSRINPILKSSKQWLATPQYLSPELLQALLAKSDQQQPDIWENKSSSDIWSLGITLFELLTMVPIWMNDSCSLKTKAKKPVVRAGLLGTDDRKLTKIAQKQKRIQKLIPQCMQNQLQQGIDKQIISLINRMITYDARQRITVDEIISVIK